jgi:hypothetical protein
MVLSLRTHDLSGDISMSGSVNWFAYTTDGGVLYSVRADESNARGTILGTRLLTARLARYPCLPRDFRKRYVNTVLASNPRIRRKFWVGNPLAWNKIGSGSIILAWFRTSEQIQTGRVDAWRVQSRCGEELILPPSISTGDTGLIDGTDGG